MGMMDYVAGKCPSCGEEFDLQTKLGDCIMCTYTIDSDVTDFPSVPEHGEFRLLLKDDCYHCKAKIVAVIIDGKINRWEHTGKFDMMEMHWGSIGGPGEIGVTDVDGMSKANTDAFIESCLPKNDKE
jgi:hypothetical protein